ncbi:MAG TPA: DUF2911 domain-containing protein [Parafilimonas sp.]|nr:DUF2911 domain-containing protein [Parafilimonas sp.]
MNKQAVRSYNFYRVSRPVIWLFLIAVILLVSCSQAPTERYGFVTLLGRDTIAVERVTWQGSTVTSDAVDRFPRVRVRHTVIDLAADGSIKHLEMNIHTPSEPADQRERKVVADVTAGSVHISKTDGTGTLNRDFATGGGIVEAHIPQMYSLYELYFAAALKHAAASKSGPGNPVQMRQFYIDREFDRFPLGRGRVTPLEGSKVEITHDWLAGPGEATVDSNYHMLSYSGDRTTYKVQVSRLSSPPDIESIAERFEAIEAKTGAVREMSVRDTARAQIGNAIFTVDYSRPLLRGRQLLGDIIPYDRVWRTGANAATQFTTSASIKLAGMQVPAGTYTLWTAPHMNGIDLMVNKQTGQWGTEYHSSQNLGTAKITGQESSTPAEAFTISIVPGDARHGTLVMEWGTFKWTAPIEVQ